MVIMDEISSLKTFCQSQNFHYSTAWLEGCLDWCKEENLPANYTLQDLQRELYKQWLILDLRDAEVPCLPLDLSTKTKYILNGNYCLQVMKIIDISKPKYWQLQRIRNNISKNVETEIESSKRVLQLTLSDGVQEVEAMEYKPISCLSLNLKPGIKIRLLGPLTVRRGRLMLESHNVKILGGEVDDLIVPNAAENILAAFLKLPLNPNPTVIEEGLLTANKDTNNTGENPTATINQNNLRNNVVNLPNPANRVSREIQQTRVTANVPRNIANSSVRPNEDLMMDIREEEELRIAAEIDSLLETERDFEKLPSARRKSRSKTPDMFDDADFDDSVFEKIEIPPVVDEKTPEPKKVPLNNEKRIPTDPDLDKSLEFGNEFFENFDIDAHLDQHTKESEWKPPTPQKPLILTIQKLMKNIPNISNGKFKIKAKFSSLVEKLTVVDDKYQLVIKVEDETGNLTVKLHSDVVSDFSGYCPGALLSLKTRIEENDSEAQRKVLEALTCMKEKLIQLNNIVEVQVNSKEKYPVIISILD